MEYLELGEVFKINVDDKTVYLKVEIDTSEMLCEDCYFNQKGIKCPEETNCEKIERDDNNNVIYKQINPIEDIFIVCGVRMDGFIKHYGAYQDEEDAKKKVEELNRYDFNFDYYYKKIKYYPYGIIDDIKEVKLINNFSTGK